MADVTCKQCGQTFNSQDQLDLHNRQMHLAGGGGMTGTPGGKTDEGSEGEIGKEKP